jgi:phosphatidylglycerophosphate synthase
MRKRQHFYWAEKFYTDVVFRLMPAIAETGITPNQITILNILNGLLILWCIWQQHYIPAALLIQLYLFLDIVDGNLARYRNLSSRLGAILDNLGDRFFYNAVIVTIGIATQTHWAWIVFFLLAHNLHAALATYYIVPRIRKTPDFKRFAVKQWLMDRDYILGMDLSSQDVIMSALLVTSWRIYIVPIIAWLYLLDLVFRLVELGRNHPTNRV